MQLHDDSMSTNNKVQLLAEYLCVNPNDIYVGTNLEYAARIFRIENPNFKTSATDWNFLESVKDEKGEEFHIYELDRNSYLSGASYQ
jgi:hypothetical protein